MEGIRKNRKNKEVEEKKKKANLLYVLQYASFSVNIFDASDVFR